jgi:coproporphyrinogen III oxidase-like Fe-S oxidoreductase
MREQLYDHLTENGYHNVIAETYSKHTGRTQYQTAHCARQDIVGVGCAARGNVKDMVSINPADVDEWMKNIDDYGVSTQTLQSIGRGGVLDRIMVMFPRYRELSKELLHRFSDVKHFDRVLEVLENHIEVGVVDDKGDRYVTNKLGTIWHGNLQTDYMRHVTNVKFKMLLHVITEKEDQFDRQERFRVNMATKFIAKHTEKYPRMMK